MTTKNNTKKFLSIIVIAIIGSMLFITCKAKPTDLNNYQVEEPAVNPTNPETPNPTNENSQKVEIKIDNNNDLRQFGEGTRENFKGYHYVSKGYIPHEFTATVGWDSYQYYIQFEDGYKFYQGAGPSCKGANYKLVIQSGASRNGGACQYADVVFTTNGYLYVKFNNYSWTIEYALSKKEEVKRCIIFPNRNSDRWRKRYSASSLPAGERYEEREEELWNESKEKITFPVTWWSDSGTAAHNCSGSGHNRYRQGDTDRCGLYFRL